MVLRRWPVMYFSGSTVDLDYGSTFRYHVHVPPRADAHTFLWNEHFIIVCYDVF